MTYFTSKLNRTLNTLLITVMLVLVFIPTPTQAFSTQDLLSPFQLVAQEIFNQVNNFTYEILPKLEVVETVAPLEAPKENDAPLSRLPSRKINLDEITRDLERGLYGEDVRELQQYLNDQGFTVAREGEGSYGNETTFFGDLTKAALIKYQESKNEEVLSPLGKTAGTGYFGPITRKVLVTELVQNSPELVVTSKSLDAAVSNSITPKLTVTETQTGEVLNIEISLGNDSNTLTTQNLATSTTFTLSYSAGSNGTIAGDKTQSVNEGGSGTSIIAVANTNYRFVNWSDGSTSNPRTDTNVTKNLSVTANFVANMIQTVGLVGASQGASYTLIYSSESNGTISGSASQNVLAGTSGTSVTAVPNSGYVFSSWSDGSTANPRTDTVVNSDLSVTANFISYADDLTTLVISDSPSNYTFAGGTYTYNSVTVLNAVSSITLTPTGSGTITVDGVTVTSGQASGAISLTAGVEKTITVVVAETGKTDKTYTIKVTRNSGVSVTPTFSPTAGAIAFGTTVTISSSGADAIYYTTDGSTPTTSSTNQATTPLVINSAVTVKALAVKATYDDSAIASAAYTQAAATAPSNIVLAVGSTAPVGGVTNVAIPSAGATDSTGAVSGWVTSTNDKIKFTVTDSGGSSTITINSSPYTNGSNYTIASATTLTIVVTTTESGKFTGVRTFSVTVTPAGSQTTPTFSPVAGAIAFGTTVTISSASADAIYYTTDGSTPTTSSTNQATTPLIINSAVTVKALAIKAGLTNSQIASASYTQAAATNLTTLVISDSPSNYTFAGGTYTYNSVTVLNAVSSITFTPTGSGTITVDGVTVTSGQASGAISLTAGVEKTITVVVTETGKTDKTYTIKVTRNSGVTTTPTFSPVAGAIAFGTTVTISSSGADAIYYTTDGSTPTTSSTNQATTPLVINSAVTVKALAVKATYDDSSVGSAAYTQAATADLSSAVVSGSPTNYTFVASTYTYSSVAVLNAVSSVTVTPTGSGAITVDSVSVTSGQASSAISLMAGVEKTITVVATETGKSAKTYTIYITRAVAAPTGLSATAVSTSQINLSWTNTDGSAQTRIYRAGVLVTTVAAGVTTYNNTGLSEGTNYVYTVRHYLNSVESADSSSANATTQYVVSVLMVGGGGGGGGGAWSAYGTGGGGGGGEFLEWSGQTVSPGGTAVTVTIGAGGGGGATNAGGPSASGSNGGNTSLSGGLSKSVAGGGAGGGHHLSGASGGNGGGAGSSLGSPGSAAPIGGGYGGGNGGAVGAGAWGYAGGGGGGAGGSGTGGLSSDTNTGGAGRASSYSGSSQTYSGGGGGCCAASGGSGGGGTGGNIYGGGVAPTAGSYYGAGGGAGVTALNGTTHYNGASGYGGIVIIRYLGSQKGTGGSVSSSGGYTIHTFTSGGTFTP